jgi:chromosome segregation ATPase
MTHVRDFVARGGTSDCSMASGTLRYELFNENDDMTENVENLVLEHLRHIRGRVDKISEDVDTIKLRMQSFDERLVSLERAVVNVHSDLALVNVRLDRIDSRLDRVERRLELRDELT